MEESNEEQQEEGVRSSQATENERTNDEGENVRLPRELYRESRGLVPGINGQTGTTPATLYGHTNSTRIFMIA